MQVYNKYTYYKNVYIFYVYRHSIYIHNANMYIQILVFILIHTTSICTYS